MGDVPATLFEHDHLSDHEIRDVRALLEAVTEADGVRPLSEHVWLHLTHGGDERAVHLCARDQSGALVGYAHLDTTDQVEGPSGELAVHPLHRRRGIGRQLVLQLLSLSAGRLRLWAHGEHTAAARLAATLGFTRHRTLWQMRRSLHSALPDCQPPPGIRLRPFRVGEDEQAFLSINARAFADLPDQGSWTLADVQRRELEDWFDPEGFLLAWSSTEATTGEPDSLAGFHWTKVHGANDHDDHSHAAIGEVYVLAVDPTWRGTGLGRCLTLAGLHYLRRLQLASVMLYVDASNLSAIRLYEELGFVRWDTDVMYRSGDF
jgi:mycothiol synthase